MTTILLTGISSFSGSFIAKYLLEEGFNVVGVVSKNWINDSDKNQRLKSLTHSSNLRLIEYSEYSDIKEVDILCLHGTSTLNYRDKNFDTFRAVAETFEYNRSLIHHFPHSFVIHTGTFSEPNESFGTELDRSFNNYSLSKAIIYDLTKSLFSDSRLLIKFVMPNVFGPLESRKFIDYLLKSWAEGKVPTVSSPNYIRDNVPIDLLARHYLYVVKNISNLKQFDKIYPSKYIESNKDFSLRYKREFEKRTGIPLSINFNDLHEYFEPRIRVNSDFSENFVESWDEKDSWDHTVEYGLKVYSNYLGN
jgi:UDP-glucose 4-epimerase